MKDKVDVYYAIVDDYDEPSRTCSCTLVSGKSDISLNSVSLMSEVNDGLLMLPTKGSTVIIAKTAHTTPFVMMYSQIDKILIIVGDTLFSLVNGTVTVSQGDSAKFTLSGDVATMQQGDDNKFILTSDKAVMQQSDMVVTLSGSKINIKNNSGDFKTIMDTHFQNFNSMTFTNGAGSTGPPNNLSSFVMDQTNFDNLFN